MSPTYWTASQIKMAAREYGWEFVPCVDGVGPWGVRRDNLRIMFQENRRGGLTWVTLYRTFDGGSDAVHLDQRYQGKLETLLEWIAGDIIWERYGLNP